MIEINDIKEKLPHRYPFLLVDRIISVDKGRKAIGVKNITGDDFFCGIYRYSCWNISCIYIVFFQAGKSYQRNILLKFKTFTAQNYSFDNPVFNFHNPCYWNRYNI